MAGNLDKKSVIQYLEQNGFKFVKCLGSGGFADVISVLTPSKEEVAIKIVQREKIWEIEDILWPTFQHPHLLQVTEVRSIESLNCKLYFMPIMPKVLGFAVHEKEFRKDPNGLNRIKKWLRQVLSAQDHLHSSGLCHLDIKSDNVLIDAEDNAKLCDFSGLNFTKCAIERFCSPEIYRPPECFTPDGASNVRGEDFDLWTFGLLALNILTGHDFLKKMNRIKKVNPGWMTQIESVLEETLKEANFKYLMRKTMPNVRLSESDVHQALHFIKFILKIRPDASRARKHSFLKMGTNPFLKDLDECLSKNSNAMNPFKKIENQYDLQSQGDFQGTKITAKSSKQTQVAATVVCSTHAEPLSFVQYEILREETDVSDTAPCVVQNDTTKNMEKRKTFGKNVKKWFSKKFNRMFK